MNRDPVTAAMGEIARIVAETLELNDVLTRVGDAARAVLPLDSMLIARLEKPDSWRLYSRSDDIPLTRYVFSLEECSPALRPPLDGILRVGDILDLADSAFPLDREMMHHGARAMLVAPLRLRDRTVGFVEVESRRPHVFTDGHEAVLSSIAEILGLALEHERLWSLNLVRRRRLEALDALLPIIANALDVRPVFEQISAAVEPVLHHDHLFLLSPNADGKLLQMDAYSGDSVEGLCRSVLHRESEDFPAGQEYFLVHDTQQVPHPDARVRNILKKFGIRSVLRLPIFFGGAPQSTLNFFSKSPHQYSEEDVPVARRVADLVSLALSHRRLAEEERRAALLEKRVESLTKELETSLGIRHVVGRSKKWKAILAQIAKVAPTETTVLLTGESGTGKEVLARMIHRSSPRNKGPFIAINCAALPETLLESELFGHEKGAFTGALGTRLGCIEQAAGGILFLDEVGEMSLAAQAKLLRVLEQREFTRVGGARALRADVRVVAATNRDLKAAIRKGTFREDLYYRLRVFEITVPPLRERQEDILLLADTFLEEIGHAVGRPAGGRSDQVNEALTAYAWPGNARELRNVIERATILCDGGLITLDHLPAEVGKRAGGLTALDETAAPECFHIESAERNLIMKALNLAKGNRAQAARLLGITRPNLYYRMQKYGLVSGPAPHSEDLDSP